MITSIRLLNWRSHSDSKLQFRKGTNLLVGMMGAGKSSIMEAISFAFFGTFPAIERRKVKLEDLVRLNERSAKVILEFQWAGTSWRVERELERSKKTNSTTSTTSTTTSSAELFKDGSLLEHGSTAVTHYIETLLAVDYDLFTRAIYAEQNNLDYFLTLDPRRRKQEIDALLGLDRFEDARANIVSVIGRLDAQRKAIETRFSKDRLQSLEKDEAAAAGKAAELETKLKETVSLATQAKLEQTKLAASWAELEKNKQLAERLEKDVVRLTAQRDSLAKDAASVDGARYQEAKAQLASVTASRAALLSSIKAADSAYLVASRELATIEAKLKSASETAERIKSYQAELATMDVPSLSARQKEHEQSAMSSESERKSLEHEVAEISDLLSRLKPGVSECPLCASKIADITHIKAERDAAIAGKKERIASLSAAIATHKKQNELLLAQVRRCSVLIEQVAAAEKAVVGSSSLNQDKSGLEAKLLASRQSADGLNKQRESLDSEIEKLRLELSNLELLLRKKSELDTTTKQLADMEARLKSINFDPVAFETLRSAVQDSRLACEKLAAEQRSLETESKHSSDLLRVVRDELATLRKMEAELSSLNQLIEQLQVYKNALLETQTSLRANLIEAINTVMADIWPIFYPHRNYPAVRLNAIEKDYVFEVNEGNVGVAGGSGIGFSWKSLESMASGGERATAALVLRVALAMVLTPNLKWLILDEPTHNLDADAIALLSSALQAKVPEVVDQTFVITHEEGLMGSEFASSYRLSRDKAQNGETKVECI